MVYVLVEEQFSEELAQLQQLPVVAAILIRLDQELPKSLVYHSLKHTLGVIEEAFRFALVEGISRRDIEILAVAAAFHDAGFLISRENHELHGAALAREALLADGSFQESEISLIEQMILDTRLQSEGDGPLQVASSRLSGYLLDADLANLGRSDFFDSVSLVKSELAASGLVAPLSEAVLLQRHSWHTSAARDLRNWQKQENLRLLVRQSN